MSAYRQPTHPPQSEGPANFEAAELERYRVETHSTWTRDEHAGKRLDAEIEDRRKRTEAEIENLSVLTTAAVRERYFFMGMTAFGAITAAVLAFVSIGQSEPAYYFTPGAGLVISAAGLFRLRGLSSERRGSL